MGLAGDPGRQTDAYASWYPGTHQIRASRRRAGGKWFSEKTFRGDPGERFDYTNVGSSLAACVVEHVVQAHELAADYNDFVRHSNPTQIHQPNHPGPDAPCLSWKIAGMVVN